MGRFVYQTFDPDLLELPNDLDFEEEGISEDYGSYREYEAYLPDKLGALRPLSEDAATACAEATEAIERAMAAAAASSAADACAELLLANEAVSTTQAEDYAVSCASMLEYAACRRLDPNLAYREAETAALDAMEAHRDFALDASGRITPPDLCAANAIFSRTSSRADDCGQLRERPVFIGRDLFDAEYVAPPADELDELMDDLVAHGGSRATNPVAQAAIAQVQLVTIHPFEDGNGRTSRAISQRLLQEAGIAHGMLPPITAAMLSGGHDYVGAIHSFVNGGGPSDPSTFAMLFARSCGQAAERVDALRVITERFLASRIDRAGDASALAMRVTAEFAKLPILTEALASERVGVDVHDALEELVDLGVVVKRQARFSPVHVYVAEEMLDALERSQR